MKNKAFILLLTATAMLMAFLPAPKADALAACPSPSVLVNSGDINVLLRVARAFPGAQYCSAKGNIKQIYATTNLSKLSAVAKVARQQTYIYR